MKWTSLVLTLFFGFSAFVLVAQNNGTIRGTVYDKESGEPIIFGTIRLEGTTIGTNTNESGFFSIGNVPPGNYTLVATYVGYDSVAVDIELKPGGIVTENIFMVESGVQLGVVNISARAEKARSDVRVSKITVTPQQIKSLPSMGGQADVAQYLPVLPGIISTGDQGGQIYIRGGSPIQNKILLDGMTIYNAFHSIGFFSVFETEIIRTMDVLTGGFNAEYGGRISAIVDIKTREGNKRRLSGTLSGNPFQTKVLFEGPIKKLDESGRGGSTSFILTGKHSYLDKTSPTLYSYATENDTLGLPYSFTDFYAKLSSVTDNGSKFNVFGFRFDDMVNFEGVARFDWTSNGGGANFTVIPPNSNLIIDGTLAFSDYEILLREADEDPRRSAITSYNAVLNFTYYGLHNEVKYGFDLNALSTDFRFKNFLGNTINQDDNTTELSGYIKYKQKLGSWILEPSMRLVFYASQRVTKLEPRFGAKWNITDRLRFKAAGGFYTQNLLSSVNDRDVVNLFVGFLSGPEQQVFKPGTTEPISDRLQKAIHGVAGFEIDLTDHIELNVEAYYKRFSQLLQVNRNKLKADDPNFAVETGDAYGLDFSLRYQKKDLYVWATYSLGRVERDDGEQVYPTIFDRRHNINFLLTYNWGEGKLWEAGARWNFGTGFPFTLTQGFYENFNFQDGISTDILTGNGDLGIIFDEKRNAGRLPSYHRLDLSLKRTVKFSKYISLEVVASVTNAYDRDNIFFFDRIRFERVNQLPILPSLGATLSF